VKQPQRLVAVHHGNSRLIELDVRPLHAKAATRHDVDLAVGPRSIEHARREGHLAEVVMVAAEDV
jgi:hypothetical protein